MQRRALHANARGSQDRPLAADGKEFFVDQRESHGSPVEREGRTPQESDVGFGGIFFAGEQFDRPGGPGIKPIDALRGEGRKQRGRRSRPGDS